MDKQVFSALMQNLPGDEFRDGLDHLLEREFGQAHFCL